MNRIMFVFPITIIIAFALVGCHRSDGENTQPDENTTQPQVLNGGTEIHFPTQSPQLQQISTDTVREQTIQIDFSAPAHVAVSVAHSEFGNSNVYLFENQDLTQLHADFIKSVSAAERSSKHLERMHDLYDHKAVAEKELLDAQAEHIQSQAELGEKESRLRAAGIDPKALGHTAAGTILAIADVPEGQVTNIQKDTKVELQCNAFADERFIGHGVSIGDVIDPATRTVKVPITIANPRNKLRAGMFGTAHFILKQHAMTIPRSAVFTIQGKSYVFVQSSPGSFQQTEIHFSSETPKFCAVNSGLKSGDIVVKDNVILLKQLSLD